MPFRHMPWRRLALLVASATLAVHSAPVFADEESSQSLRGIDVDGRSHCLGSDEKCRAVAVVFLSTDCPISNGYVPALNGLAKRHGERVDFVGVISASTTTRAEAVAHRDEFKIQFPVLFDASGELRRGLRPSHTPQAFVLNAAGEVVYTGAVDDRYAEVGRPRLRAEEQFLADAIAATLAGRAVATPVTKPVGCRMEEPPAEKPTTDVTYARDVAPIVMAHCADCHRPGQRAPFPLLSYDDVSDHAAQIVDVTHSRLMPPWKPEPNFGHFADVRRLSEREIHLIATWAKNGKPRGDEADLPPVPEFTNGWKLGEPDLVLTMEEDFAIPADGPDMWQHFVFRPNLARDRLVSAVEFRPGNAAVVHHASFYLDMRGQARKLDAMEPDYGYRGPGGGPLFAADASLRSWFPGANPQPLPKGTGRLFPRNADLVLEVHYHPIGRAERDRSQVGVHFAKRGARQLVDELLVMDLDLTIPAGESEHRHTATLTLPVDVQLLDAAPHMHLLGQSVKATATTPDGRRVPLVWVKDWDFNWQGHYQYERPVELPAGTTIEVEYVYDNSTGNPQNPNSPPIEVEWGDASSDEMGICQFHYTCKSLADFERMRRHQHDYSSRQYEVFYRENRDHYLQRMAK